jgi:catechol 2,3-dioxygenase-like lactoylglutathione lyase family enzyme
MLATRREGGPLRLVHTNVRDRDIDASLRFYEALGFERRGRLQFAGAYNVYLGLPGGRTEYRICFVADPDGYASS